MTSPLKSKQVGHSERAEGESKNLTFPHEILRLRYAPLRMTTGEFLPPRIELLITIQVGGAVRPQGIGISMIAGGNHT